MSANNPDLSGLLVKPHLQPEQRIQDEIVWSVRRHPFTETGYSGVAD
ncbi:MAG: hypothetical protein Q8904_03030 [Bacteroidota bacterium]|nr:hypothetical protein [Bacteroidota bacterium]